MNETVLIALIGLFGTIFGPIVTYYLTNRGNAKKAEVEKEQVVNKNNEMILKIKEQHKNELEKKEKENQHNLNLIEKDYAHAINLLKIQTETEIDKANQLESNSSINQLAANFIQDALKQPNNELSKEINSVIKRGFITSKKK